MKKTLLFGGLLALAAAGCGTEMGVGDAGGGPDARVSADLGGARPDAAELDAAVPETGTSDAGSSNDAGASNDAGTPDAGSSSDAGTPDAATSNDAGPPDAGPMPCSGPPTCSSPTTVRTCNPSGLGFTEMNCIGGRACVMGGTGAVCQCVRNGRLGCHTDDDVYEYDSCGTRLVTRIADCVLARAERCVDDEFGVRCAQPVTCSSSSICGPGRHCTNGLCAPDVCDESPPGNRPYCDGQAVVQCNGDGSALAVVETCGAGGSGEVCTTFSGAPYADCRCAADARIVCEGAAIVSYNSCGARGGVRQTCTSPMTCVDGPTGPACAMRTTCTRDAECGASRICEAGVCVAQACTPGAQRCSGAQAQRCDARGSRYEALDDCTNGETCTVTGSTAACRCTPNARRGCSETDIYQFDSCGTRGALAMACVDPQVCVDGPSGAVCAGSMPPTTACVADGDCGTGRLCSSGACVDRVCTPGTSFCSAGAVYQCDSRGAAQVLVVECTGGRVCTQAGTPRCECVASAALGCRGGDVVALDSCGNPGAIVADCTAGAACVASGNSARCAPPPPPPPAPTCTPRASRACYNEDLYWFDSCGAPGELAEACPGQIFCNTIGGPAACRSSVADMASPHWDRSCPLVQDITLQTRLPADCRCNNNRVPANGILNCIGAVYVPASTRIGTGPAPRELPQSHLNGGVIVGRELFVGVDWSMGTRSGLVMAINLDTGNRRIVSGAFLDPRTGLMTVGTGPAFHGVIDVERASTGELYALSVPTVSADLEIVRVDPSTGNRTLVWRGRDPAFGQCASGDLQNTTRRLVYHERVFGLDPAGDFYLAFRGGGFTSEGVGIVRISRDGARCSFVTRSGAGSLNAYANTHVGTGYDLDRGWYAGLEQKDGKLYVINDVYNALFEIDPATGNRVRLSSAATSWGVLGSGPVNYGGLGERWLTWDPSRSVMWSTGVLNYRAMLAVDLTSGDRVEAFCRSSGNAPNAWRDTCLGGVLEGGFQNWGGFWIDPQNQDPIVVHENYSLVRVDLRNGNSMRISM